MDRALYPDLAEAGSLAAALRRELEQLNSELASSPAPANSRQPVAYAYVSTEERSSQVYIAKAERQFSVDFWVEGVQYGKGWTPELADVARAIDLFVGRNANLNSMRTEFPWFKEVAGELHQRGPEGFVEATWLELLSWLRNQPYLLMSRVLPAAEAAAEDPALRALLPFLSHHRLCFSRTTGYPFDSLPLCIWPTDDGRYAVGADEEPIHVGLTPRAAVALVAAEHDGSPARHGTRDSRGENP